MLSAFDSSKACIVPSTTVRSFSMSVHLCIISTCASLAEFPTESEFTLGEDGLGITWPPADTILASICEMRAERAFRLANVPTCWPLADEDVVESICEGRKDNLPSMAFVWVDKRVPKSRFDPILGATKRRKRGKRKKKTPVFWQQNLLKSLVQV